MFTKLKHFTESEFKHPDKMDFNFLVKLDSFRSLLNKPFHITEDFAYTGHVSNSQHYSDPCKCVDGYAMTSLLHMYLCAESLGFKGIGLYPAEVPFVHLDCRDMIENSPKARWIGIKEDNEMKYLEFNEDNFRKYVCHGRSL